MEQSLVKNSADEKQVKDGKTKEERLRQQELHDIYAVMSTVHGRRFMWRLVGHLYDNPGLRFEASSKIYRDLGEQQAWSFLWNELRKCDEELFQLMIKESKERERVQ